MTQPPPKKTGRSRPVMQSLLKMEHVAQNRRLVGALNARRMKGVRTYGTELHTFNGRSMYADAEEELLDAMVYLHGLRLELRSEGKSTYRADIAFEAAYQAIMQLWIQD